MAWDEKEREEELESEFERMEYEAQEFEKLRKRKSMKYVALDRYSLKKGGKVAFSEEFEDKQ